jgi:hypothetical protein
MRAVAITLAFCMATSIQTIAAQQFGPEPDDATRRELLQLREAVWRAWFSNDQVAFQRIVPAELVALSWNGGAWQDRSATLKAMATFAEGGQAIQALEFPRNVFQRYGDVVILYTTFRIVLADREGKQAETTGRGTEIFVRREGRWIHTGWHLDTVR